MSTWIPSAEAFGTPLQTLTLGAAGIPTSETFGTPSIAVTSVILLQPVGAVSAEAFGTLDTLLTLRAAGIPTREAFGNTNVDTVTNSILCSASAYGIGQLLVGEALTAGAAFGTATLSNPTPTIIVWMDPVAYGHGTLTWAGPLPAEGQATLVSLVEILKVPPPICGPICGCENCCGRREEACEPCRQWHWKWHHREAWWWQCRECWERHFWHRREDDGEHLRDQHGHEHEHEWSREPNPGRWMSEFRWNQIFGRGDLEICIKDRLGNQRGPVFIAYTMFMVLPTGVLHQTGPTDRKPAQADVGKFYVTGTAGENGQPGCWAVRWRYQRTYGDPITEQLVQFRVLDAVLDCDRDRRDHVHRHCKYGWDL